MPSLLIIIMLAGDVYNTTTIEFSTMEKCDEAKELLVNQQQFKEWIERKRPVMECVYA